MCPPTHKVIRVRHVPRKITFSTLRTRMRKIRALFNALVRCQLSFIYIHVSSPTCTRATCNLICYRIALNARLQELWNLFIDWWLGDAIQHKIRVQEPMGGGQTAPKYSTQGPTIGSISIDPSSLRRDLLLASATKAQKRGQSWSLGIL